MRVPRLPSPLPVAAPAISERHKVERPYRTALRRQGTQSGAIAFCVAMSRSPYKAERPALTSLAEAERQARAEKNARLRNLRTHTSWLVLDPDALFRDEIDCSALFGDITMPKVSSS